MRALGYYVVVRDSVATPTKTKGGLLLTDSHKEDVRFKEAEVVSVGEDVKGLECCDIVLYDKHAGNGLEHKGELYKVIKAQDVSVVL